MPLRQKVLKRSPWYRSDHSRDTGRPEGLWGEVTTSGVDLDGDTVTESLVGHGHYRGD